ncbi:uncharacterized protein LACBIDRAFT_326161 [Laccaria bicolor S238N-H82]|uniref:Predicted protein n=1 Tax=Laccaria bicolor (strain S238N-H82 / ATCC MYA-4686) TaxID=486041 RepID=B0D7H8_LACBS|nr:uncharacterized protein LACBIDRAFT_326161 [Laccaria bicolor S238N-H82]EDR09656.1 predicted protein [Laccaria bicolor S238N-H82]|eukprot:XP_001880005.1 predicted protein [Laccaria bicolor S238N-H82]
MAWQSLDSVIDEKLNVLAGDLKVVSSPEKTPRDVGYQPEEASANVTREASRIPDDIGGLEGLAKKMGPIAIATHYKIGRYQLEDPNKEKIGTRQKMCQHTRYGRGI